MKFVPGKAGKTNFIKPIFFLQVISKIIHASLEAIVVGSCKLAIHRNSENVGLHDVVLFLSMYIINSYWLLLIK